MNRTIEFRGKTIFDSLKRWDGGYDVPSGTFVYGSLVKNKKGGDMIHVCGYTANGEGFEMKHLVDSDTVGQFTGLCDKNKRKIFEGDIVRISMGQKRPFDGAEWEENYEDLEVQFKGGAFNISEYEHCTDLLEVIGTKYDSVCES